jgi:alpha-tubulin suppressor-like RCC1 family protein
VFSGGVAIAAGFHHALVLKADGTVWAWGHNYIGEVGDGTTTARRAPQQVPGLTNVVAIAASFYNSYAIKADGTLWAWGNNGWGQIGDGTTTNRLSPVQVPGLTGVQAIAAGESFALAIVSNGASIGAVWAWGYNNVGQLGDGTSAYHLTPRPVVGASSVKNVFAGRAWSMARTADDELLLWGANDNGQQGIGPRADGYNNTNNYVPVRTGPWIGPVAQIGGGYLFALALGKDGRPWGWGDDCEFELAYAPCDFRLSVEPIAAFPNAAYITAGGYHTIAVAQDGQVWTWGYNGQGQIGDGTLTNRSVPAAVAGMQLVNNAFMTGDQDNDGLPTWREYLLGTDPLSADTDGDGIPDGIDTASGDVGTNLDPDGDGLSNAMEALLGTDPYNADTDGDGVPDGLDAYPLDPTRWSAPASDPTDHTPPVITLIYPSNARPVGGGL